MKNRTLPLLAACLLVWPSAWAQQVPAKQDVAQMKQTIARFLEQQTAGVAGAKTITVGNIDMRNGPAACPQLEAFLPAGSRAWGKTVVGLRCAAPAWQRFIEAKVAITGEYVAAAAPLTQGQALTRSQLVMQSGELTTLPQGVVTDMAQAEGRVLTISMQAGAPLRSDTLRAQPVIQQGQAVQLVSSGKGFRVSTEARALGNAIEGQVVQVKTQAGKQLSGIARTGGIVEIK
ncbi:MAG TPA: flagellar basal body P-ring formation chaperone FlgA [Burkholderiaceae bacterium]